MKELLRENERNIPTMVEEIFYLISDIEGNFEDIKKIWDKKWIESEIKKLGSEISHLKLKAGMTNEESEEYNSLLEKLHQDKEKDQIYIDSQKWDQISDMSPWKRSFVLLKLLIELDNSRCPILLDQPEDDLDNRSIYSYLCRWVYKRIILVHKLTIEHFPTLWRRVLDMDR